MKQSVKYVIQLLKDGKNNPERHFTQTNLPIINEEIIEKVFKEKEVIVKEEKKKEPVIEKKVEIIALPET